MSLLEKKYLTAADAAQYVGYTPNTLAQYRCRRIDPSYLKARRRVLYAIVVKGAGFIFRLGKSSGKRTRGLNRLIVRTCGKRLNSARNRVGLRQAGRSIGRSIPCRDGVDRPRYLFK